MTRAAHSLLSPTESTSKIVKVNGLLAYSRDVPPPQQLESSLPVPPPPALLVADELTEIWQPFVT